MTLPSDLTLTHPFIMIRQTALTTLAALAFSASSLLAAPQTFDFKDAKGVNNATFKLDAPLEAINGAANGVSGTLTIDPEAPEKTAGKIIVDAKTLHVENAAMKEHLHGPQWLDSAKYGEISFELVKLTDIKTESDVTEATALGKFTLHGVTKELSVPVKATLLKGKLGARTNGKVEGDLLVLRSNFTIKRTDYGINPSAPTDKVADEIQISLSIAGASPKA